MIFETISGRVLIEREKYVTKFFHRKALTGVTFCWVIWPLVNFRQNFFQKFAFEVIMVLMISVSIM